jgi:hypothetical protein
MEDFSEFHLCNSEFMCAFGGTVDASYSVHAVSDLQKLEVLLVKIQNSMTGSEPKPSLYAEHRPSSCPKEVTRMGFMHILPCCMCTFASRSEFS